MDASDHFGDTCFDASLLAELGDVFALLANDDTGFPGRDETADGKSVSGEALACRGRGLARGVIARLWCVACGADFNVGEGGK